jgi:hypothetical protein
VLVAQIKLVHLAGYIESDMTRGYNVRVMNIADDHKPFSHRPRLSHLDCPVAATAAGGGRTDVAFTPALLSMSL